MRALPEAIHREFVEALFEMALPVLGLGIVYVGVALVAAHAFDDPVLTMLSVAGALVTTARLVLIAAYRNRSKLRPDAEFRWWEQRYAEGSYAFALLLAAINLRALAWHAPLLHLVTVSLVFGYGAGIVARISIRPRICVTSIVLAAVPTVCALLAHANMGDSEPIHGQLLLVEASLLAIVTGLSIQTVLHLYRTARSHLATQHDLAHIAKRDILTGLPNRLLLRESFEISAASSNQGSQLALLCIDLDGFKTVNDTLGHPAGDALLCDVARRLTRTVRAQDTVARLGGDEFVILQTQVRHSNEAQMLARRILRVLNEPHDIGGQQAQVSASIGIALSEEGPVELDRLLARADAALYAAKSNGKGCARVASLVSNRAHSEAA